MSDEKVLKPKGSCLGKLAALIALAGVGGLAAAVYFIVLPQDLSDLKTGAAAGQGRDLRAVLKNSVDRSFPVTLTEEEINLYLKKTLAAKQGGLLESSVSLDGVRVRLEEGVAEIITERTVMGQLVTLSMFLRIEQTLDVKGRAETSVFRDGGPFMPEIPRTARLVKGGRFGRLVVPQGFLLLVLPSFEKLAKVYETELKLGFEEMSRMSISDGKLQLDPRPDGGAAMPGPTGSF